jgi:steroid delta-isomerase-like uncharacterized protein
VARDTPEGTRLLRKFFDEFWNKRRFDILEEIVTKDCLLHFGASAHAIASEKSRRAQQQWVKSFPDLKFTIQDIIEQGDLVAARLTFEGTQEGEFEGIPPSNKRIRVTETLFARISEDKICEMWEEYDMLGMLKQLGFNLTSPNT